MDERDRMEQALNHIKEAFEEEIKKRDFQVVQLESQAKLVQPLKDDLRQSTTQVSQLKAKLVKKDGEISELSSQVDLLEESVDMVKKNYFLLKT